MLCVAGLMTLPRCGFGLLRRLCGGHTMRRRFVVIDTLELGRGGLFAALRERGYHQVSRVNQIVMMER